MVVGSVGVASWVLATAISGSYFAKGNFVCDITGNPNCGIVSGDRPSVIPLRTVDTNTGGLAKYDAIRMTSPFNSTASTRGHKTGTGVIKDLTLHLIRNHSNASFDCAVVVGAGTLTGSTRYSLPGLQNISGSGTIKQISTATGVILGPNESIKCATTGTINSTFSGSLTGIAEFSEVIN